MSTGEDLESLRSTVQHLNTASSGNPARETARMST
jgi:hypothetical protein